MSAAIWVIMYDLNSNREAEYLDWFHSVHVPEKLARPGYTWAAHYAVERNDAETAAADGNKGYIALFGGTSTSIFYNPSPAQLAPTQPPETKDMMGCRVNSKALILAVEWAADGDGVIGDGPSTAINAPMISLALSEVAGNDMDFGAWLVQEHLPAMAADPGCTGAHKLLASTGGARHALLHQFAEAAVLMDLATPDSREWSARVAAYTDHPLGGPLRAKRLWPA